VGISRILGWRSRPNTVTETDGTRSVQKIISLARDLLSDSGGITAARLAADTLSIYRTLDRTDRLAFFELLIRNFSPNPDDVGRAADAYRQDPSPETLRQLQHVVESPRQELFRRLNMAPEGTRELIEIRRQVLSELESNPRLEPIAADLGHLMASWFNSGFLTLERIDWHSSAVVLEKLIAYEAVHQIQGWGDLRRRLEADRRCYAYFHSALPGEPLIFIEVALTRGISDRIHPLIDPEAPIIEPESADSAVFYSITNCQRGLRGVPFGGSLIKQVVEDLKQSLPRVRTYATLSPIPGFRKWLDKQPCRPELRSMLEKPESAVSEKWPEDLRQSLLALCAFYLLHAKRDREPLDSVARFHLKNGACLERINWMGDPSTRGIEQSVGLMANYVYVLGDLQRNHESYVRSGEVSCARRIERLARQALRNGATPVGEDGQAQSLNV
jgi:malonyl-CoA decarboxylase